MVFSLVEASQIAYPIALTLAVFTAAFGNFVKGDELGRKFQYDREAETLVLPCDDLEGEKSRLNIWYATEQAKEHPTKYEYFITPWNETESEK